MFVESFQGQYKDGTNGRPTRDLDINYGYIFL